MNKFFFIPIGALLLLITMTARADLSFSDKMQVTDVGIIRLQGIEKSGPLSGLRFGSAASVSPDGDLIRTISFYNQGAWLDNESNLTGGLIIRRHGTAHVHISTGGTVRVRNGIGQDVVIDIDVDTDRDGDVDADDDANEDIWTKGTGSRGAIVLPNCDDDGMHGYPDNWIQGDWDYNIGDEPANTTIDNEDDVEDIAPLHIARTGRATLPDDLIITLRVFQVAGESSYFTPTAAENRLRIFLPRNDSYIQAGDNAIIGPEDGAQAKFVKTVVNQGEYPYGIFAGNGIIQFGIEGIEFGAMVDIELIMEDDLGEIGRDKVRIRVAPFAMWDHTCEANTATGSNTTAYIEDLGIPNEELRENMKTEFNQGENRLDEAITGDKWHQDGYEIGYAKAPYGQLPVILTLPRGHQDCVNPADLSTCDNDLNGYVHNELLRPDVGVCNQVEGAITGDQDDGGNIECIPRGNGSRPGYLFYGDAMKQDIVDFFAAQDVNQLKPVTTDWMLLGHVDEIVSYAPDGQRVLVADPEVCWALLVWAWGIDPTANMNLIEGPPLTLDMFLNNEDYRSSNFDSMMAPTHLPHIRKTDLRLPSPESTPVAETGSSESFLKGGAFIGFFPNDLKRYYRITFSSATQYGVEYREEGGSWSSDARTGDINSDCVFKDALCFILKHWWSNSEPPGAGDVFTFNADPLCTTLEIPVCFHQLQPLAITNNAVNCLVKDASTVFTAEIFGPETDYLGNGNVSDILDDYRNALFSKVYSTVYTPLEMVYHVNQGSIHCATNVQRVIPTYNWWDY